MNRQQLPNKPIGVSFTQDRRYFYTWYEDGTVSRQACKLINGKLILSSFEKVDNSVTHNSKEFRIYIDLNKFVSQFSSGDNHER